MREDLVPANGVQYNIELRECRDWYTVGARRTGVYTVMWMGRMKKNVRCNMDLDGGGWTVFQRRYKPLSQNFNNYWSAYKRGFGEQRVLVGQRFYSRDHIIKTALHPYVR